MKIKTAGDSNKRKEVGAGKGKIIVRSSNSISFFALLAQTHPLPWSSRAHFASRALELNEKGKRPWTG